MHAKENPPESGGLDKKNLIEIASCGLYQLISKRKFKKNYFCGLGKVRTEVPVALFSFFLMHIFIFRLL